MSTMYSAVEVQPAGRYDDVRFKARVSMYAPGIERVIWESKNSYSSFGEAMSVAYTQRKFD